MTGSPLPSDAILLHIGPHKTGTTALQGVLADAREDMAAQGVLYPGEGGAHHLAARAVTANPSGWKNDNQAAESWRWHRLCNLTRAHEGRVVISSEFFALASEAQRKRIVDGLGTERLHVVIAARNPGSIALSTWQQVLRDGKTGGLDGWLHQQFERPEPTPVLGHQGFWSWADPATLVAKWSALVDPSRVHVIVLDETDRTHLPRSIEELLDLEPGMLTQRTPPLSNRSLTVPEAELLQQAIRRTRPELTWSEFSTLFRFGFASHLLRNRTPPADEARAALPAWASEQAQREAAEIVRRLTTSGADVIGDPQHLEKVPGSGVSIAPETLSTDLAADAIAGVVLVASRRLRALTEELEEERAHPNLDSISTRELSRYLAARVKAGAGRRLRGPKQ